MSGCGRTTGGKSYGDTRVISLRVHRDSAPEGRMPRRLTAGARPSDGEKGTTMTGVLDGQVAIVSGAGRGIGLAIAKTLAEAGAAVALVARTEADINTAASTIRRAGGRAMPFAADVTDIARVREVVDRTER